MYRLIVVVFFVCYFLPAHAQEKLTSATVESKSYKLYTDKNWKELIQFGNEAVAQNFDYYYLRLRLGIAYYELKKYRPALKQFLKAKKFNSKDDLLLEYIYYSYIFTAQFNEAKKLTHDFSSSLSQKLKTEKLSFFDFALLEAGEKNEAVSDSSVPTGYLQPAIGFSIARSVFMFESLTILHQAYTHNVNSQNQLYSSFNIPFAGSWSVTPAFNIVGKKSVYDKPPKGMGHPPPGPIPNDTSYSNQITSIAFKKTFSYWSLGFGSLFANFDSDKEFQRNLNFTIYPKGNNKIYFNTTLYSMGRSKSNSPENSLSESINWNISKKFFVSVSYLANNSKYLVEDNGSTVYYAGGHSNSLLDSKGSLFTNYVLSRHFDLYLYLAKENWEIENPPNIIKTPLTFNYNTLILGLKLKL